MAEKRRHTRVVHRDVVRFDAAGTTIEGFSVDLSRTGIQVEVAVPHSFDHVEMIRFALPDRESELEIPVRVARKSDHADGSGQYTLAFEFLHSADREIRLVENYIRELRERDRSSNNRRMPRVDCSVPADCGPGITDATIQNISPEGILVSADGTITVGAEIAVEFCLPGDNRPIRGRCRVAYVILGGADGFSRFGAPFQELPTVYRARIHSFIERNAATHSLRSVWSRLERNPDHGYRMDGDELRRILRTIPGIIFHLLSERDLTIYTGFAAAEETAVSIRIIPAVSSEVAPGDAVFVSFSAQGSNYCFSTLVVARGDTGDTDETVLTIRMPRRIHRSDNRSNRRTPVTSDDDISLWIHDAPNTAVPGKVLDVSRRGFLCEIAGTDAELDVFREGVSVEFRAAGPTVLFPQGRIRHIAEKQPQRSLPNDLDQRVIHVGVETGVRHGRLRKRVITAAEWETRVHGIRAGASEETPLHDARRITYRNRREQELVALENRVGMDNDSDGAEPTVVIIPPAFGKKKESPAPLALTICETFRRAGAPVVVIRFDGINRPGESHNDGAAPVRGYEMLHYRPTQGVDDITATLDYLFDTADFNPGTVILITSSMSSVDARKLLVGEKRIGGWISLMGVPAARTTLMNVLAGTDIIGNYRLNIPNG
ncbi:MAG: PilZ domain-containing protein, partial [Spirochaeta sp.]|nr:PilZ domain-containing protein [Spirochaeta sp.]